MAGLPPPLPLLVVIGAVVDLIYGTIGFTVVFAIPSYILWKEDRRNNKLQERGTQLRRKKLIRGSKLTYSADVADYETFFSFKNSIPYHNVPSFHSIFSRPCCPGYNGEMLSSTAVKKCCGEGARLTVANDHGRIQSAKRSSVSTVHSRRLSAVMLAATPTQARRMNHIFRKQEVYFAVF